MRSIRRIKLIDLIYILVVLTTLFASGGNLLIRSIYFFVASCGFLLLYKRKINHKYIMVCGSLIVYIWVDSVLLNTAPTDLKECVLMTLRLIGCVIIVSSISSQTFKIVFLKVMIVLAIISLLFYAIILINTDLPGAVVINGWYGTFYQTIGHTTHIFIMGRKRNCGIFTEPGVFQMYLNIALMVLIGERSITTRTAKKIFWLFTVTLLTTFSTMGYLLYACVLLLYYTERPEILPSIRRINRKGRLLILFFAFMVVVLFEIKTGMITQIITTTNSYASRHDDTLLTFLIARDYPIFGVGLGTDMTDIWLQYYDKYDKLRLYKSLQMARSNGLGNYLCMAGIPFTVLYCGCIIKTFFKTMGLTRILPKIITSFIVIMFFMEEPLLPTPFFLMSFFACMRQHENSQLKLRSSL